MSDASGGSRATAFLRTFTPLLVGFAVLLVPGTAHTFPALQEDVRAQEALQKAQLYIDAGEPREALEEIEKALDYDEGLWTAHFLKGMALGQMGDESEALESFLHAADLSPGTPDVHFWAGIAAFGIEDYDTCWEQTILAHLAGRDMSAEFEQLKEVSDPPDDWEARIRVPRVIVGQMDTSVTKSNSALATTLQLVQGELRVAQRMLAQELVVSPAFGLVRSRTLADYVMRISVTDYGGGAFAEFEIAPGELVAPGRGTESHELIGQLELLDAGTGEMVHFLPLEFRDLTSGGDLSADVRRHVERMERWVRENPRR